MKPAKDAYGQEIFAHLKGKKSSEIVERDDGFISVSGGAESYFAEYKDWSVWQKKLLNLQKAVFWRFGQLHVYSYY